MVSGQTEFEADHAENAEPERGRICAHSFPRVPPFRGHLIVFNSAASSVISSARLRLGEGGMLNGAQKLYYNTIN